MNATLSAVLVSGGKIASALAAGGTPSALIIDEDGKVATEVGVGAPAVLELAGASAK